MKPLPSISQTFSVNYNYKLHFTQGLFSIQNKLFEQILNEYVQNGPVKALFVVDAGVQEHHENLQVQIEKYCNHFSSVIDFRGVLVVPGGEESKNEPVVLQRVLESINKKSICRHSFVIVIGGGAVIDMVGYAAAIAHRGVKLIRIPTTVLSQNDSAVGVKNSINEFGKKNFLGTFAPAQAIINDVGFLTTLEQRDWIAGIAEAIKVSLIKDGDFFQQLVQNATALAERKMEPMQQLIYRCAELHMQHIAQGGDPFESGSSRPLDFGHWAAHKLEAMTKYKLRHGEAVAMGIALDVTYANLMGLVDDKTLNLILSMMGEIGFDLRIPIHGEEQVNELLGGIEEFREHLGGQLTITLINGIGKKYDVHEIDFSVMKKAIEIRMKSKSP
jgi:3-dehydroquinate synthase